MTTAKYDVLILGGGNAGMGVTVPTRAAGLKVALVEDRELGGTCPNRGCTPKKVLVAAAHALHEIEQAKVHQIQVGKPVLDWGALIEREKSMISHIPASLSTLMTDRGVEVIRDRAAFVGPNAVRVGERTIEANHVVIATGSKPRGLPIPGAEHMITSDDVLSERTLPSEVIFVGGGVIALEFSHVYARAGAKVTILEALPRVLAGVDADAVDRIIDESKRIGISIHTDVKVSRIERTEDRLRVAFEHQGTKRALEADRVVNGAGRIADVDGLELAAGDVKDDRGRIAVDEYLRSVSNPAVYVCGDALWSSPQLSPIATYEGRIVGRNIVEGPRHRPDYASIPSCVYTVPTIASVGLTELSAKEKGLAVKVQTQDMRDWLSARTFAETVAWAKVIIDETSDRILGAHVVGHSGEELIHTFAFAMMHGITAGQIRTRSMPFRPIQQISKAWFDVAVACNGDSARRYTAFPTS
jgi:glutathione reductase (NADPH)